MLKRKWEKAFSGMQMDNVPKEETMPQERCGRRAAWDLAKIIYKLKHSDKTTF